MSNSYCKLNELGAYDLVDYTDETIHLPVFSGLIRVLRANPKYSAKMLMFNMMFDCLARPYEVYSLKWKDINLDKRTIQFSRNRNLRTEGRVSMNNVMHTYVDNIYNKQLDNIGSLGSDNDKCISDMYVFGETVEDSFNSFILSMDGLGVTDGKHSFDPSSVRLFGALFMIQGGVSTNILSTRMRHEDQRTTKAFTWRIVRAAKRCLWY